MALNNLQDVMAVTNVDNGILTLLLKNHSGETNIPLDSQLEFEVVVRDTGYLLVINRDPVGKVQAFYPPDGDINASYVDGLATIRIPKNEDNALYARKLGVEHMRAVLFKSKSLAEQALKNLHYEQPERKLSGLQFDEEKKESKTSGTVDTGGIHTSDILLLVTKG